MANLDDQWKAVSRDRSKSLGESISSQSKSARKNARRKARKQFERKWGVRPEEAAAGEARAGEPGQGIGNEEEGGGRRMRSQSLVEHMHASALPSDDDEALRRALAASLIETNTPVAQNVNSTSKTACSDNIDDDVRKKQLRNLRKKISAAEALRSIPTTDLDASQKAKLERLPSLVSEATAVQEDLDREEKERRLLEEERKVREMAAHKQRIREWTDLSDGIAVEGFRAGADQDEFACPLCAGPLEAATACTPCKHSFCRACLEDALDAAASRTGGDPKSLCCPLCRSLLYDAKSDTMLVEGATNVRRRMRKRKCSCRCGEEVLLSSLRAHLRQCDAAAPELFKGDEKKRFGHTFFRPWLDPDLVAEMAGRKKRPGGSGPIRSSRQAIQRGLVTEDYDEDAALQAALALSALET
mmetsp:Transcript_22684/g.65341  ORF Transcript_22684/g.65341 Transcript_22684/m.65341 type:complete len:415 (+) Transcript_22684:116-1360(+)